MGLLSYFKRQPDPELAAPAPEPASAEPDAVAAARARARRRLLGATVLLGVGVIGFPLLFETQPRPIPVDIPIEIPSKDKAPALSPPTAGPAARAASAAADVQMPTLIVPGSSGAAERAAAAPVEIVEQAGEQGRELPATPRVPAASGARPAAAPSSKPVAAAAPGQAASAAAPLAAKPADDGARARALLDGQVPAVAAASAVDSAAQSPRVVVQVGAYTDPAKLGDARRKLEALGFKTYTQVVETEAGKRTRVRVGPFASRAEADKAAGRIKAAGLPAAILTL